MTLLRKALALQVSCSIRMGFVRDPSSRSNCSFGSRATTKNTCRLVWCCTQRLAYGVSSLVSPGEVVSEGVSRAFVDVDAGGVELPIDSEIVEPRVVDAAAC